jgi:hypothetical protein
VSANTQSIGFDGPTEHNYYNLLCGLGIVFSLDLGRDVVILGNDGDFSLALGPLSHSPHSQGSEDYQHCYNVQGDHMNRQAQ